MAQMRRRIVVAAVFTLGVWLAAAATATAGGWATVELEKPVTQVEAGAPVTFEFMLLQHGVTPAGWTTTWLTATNTDTGETLRVDATPGEVAGQWSVTVTFPSAGSWDWAIETADLFVEDTFPALNVIGDVAVAGSTGGVTPAQLDAAISGALEPLNKQLASMSGEIDTLRKQVSNLTAERDTLQKRVTNLETAPTVAPEASASGPAWWLAALVGALSGALVVAGAGLVAFGRGLVRRPELAPATA